MPEKRNLNNHIVIFLNSNARLVMLAPAALFVLLMMIFPVIYTLILSLNKWSVTSTSGFSFVGLANYWNVLTDVRFLGAVARTIYYTTAAVGIELVIGIGVALTFNKEFARKNVIRTLFLLPIMATPVAISLTWSMLLDPNSGLINYLLSVFHLPTSLWASDPVTVIPSLVLVDIWKWTPLIVIILMAGLSTLPQEPFESALIDGARPDQIFFYVTLPLLRPVIMVALLFRVIDALKTFDIIFVITEGGPGFASETLNIYAYLTAFDYFRMGYAASILVFYFVLILLISLIFIILRRGDQ